MLQRAMLKYHAALNIPGYLFGLDYPSILHSALANLPTYRNAIRLKPSGKSRRKALSAAYLNISYGV